MKQWQKDLIAEEEGIDPAKDDMIEAAGYIKAAIDLMDKASFKLMDAQSILQEYPMGDKVGDIYESLLDLGNVLHKMNDAYGQGIREY